MFNCVLDPRTFLDNSICDFSKLKLKIITQVGVLLLGQPFDAPLWMPDPGGPGRAA
jgi:hypothetical protein